MIRVIIADDHDIFRHGLSSLLGTEKDIQIEGEAGNGREALDLIIKMRPDVAVLDISMPEMSGIDVVEKINGKGLRTRFVFLTTHKEPAIAEKAISLGAEGYVLKDNTFNELLGAIRDVVSGRKFVSPSIASELFYRSLDTKGGDSSLTKREKEILVLIAGGLTNRETSEKLCISIKTVDTHRSNIMKKLNARKTADLVRYALANNLLE